ncbi:MAG: Phytoene dehydrogenase, partial [uncultured Gemmatimonadetes bacterium]
GTTSIVAGLVKLLGEMDVDVRMSSPVEEIEVSGGRAVAVRTADGQRFAADVVVANADPSRVYGQMVGPAHRRRHTNRSLRRRRQSMSLFVAYFGSRKQFPELAHHTIVLGDRYKPLLDDIFTRRVLADDFSLYLHAPTRTDPSLAPEGNEGFYVLSPVPNTRSGIDWSREAQPYWERIRASLEKRLLPGLGESPVKPFFLTPHDFEHTLRSEDGAAFGLEPSLTQSAYFRYHNRSEDVGGLYFVGAGTHPGGGVPGVLCSARVLDRVVPAPRRAA